MKFYGSIDNRINENKMYCEKIDVGTGVTEYSYSDSRAYEVVDVVDQKHVFVREYKHEPVGEKMSNDWKLISDKTKPIKELKFRYGKWNWVNNVTKESIKNLIIFDDKIQKAKQKLDSGIKSVEIFYPANVSFGIAEFYYDYEF